MILFAQLNTFHSSARRNVFALFGWLRTNPTSDQISRIIYLSWPHTRCCNTLVWLHTLYNLLVWSCTKIPYLFRSFVSFVQHTHTRTPVPFDSKVLRRTINVPVLHVFLHTDPRHLWDPCTATINYLPNRVSRIKPLKLLYIRGSHRWD